MSVSACSFTRPDCDYGAYSTLVMTDKGSATICISFGADFRLENVGTVSRRSSRPKRREFGTQGAPKANSPYFVVSTVGGMA
jgi:hypothetical protein